MVEAAAKQAWWSKLAPWGCLVGAALLVVLTPPPTALSEFMGSVVWARLGLGVVVFAALYAILMALGITEGKIGLPFGLSFERTNSPTNTQISLLITLDAELRALRDADARIFHHLSEIAALQSLLAERLREVEGDLSNDKRELAGEN